MNKPIGVSEYRYKELPEKYKTWLIHNGAIKRTTKEY